MIPLTEYLCSLLSQRLSDLTHFHLFAFSFLLFHEYSFNISANNLVERINHHLVFILFSRAMRSHVATKECIFELPNLTIQATRAQTFLLQTIWQSWAYIGNTSSPMVNEALLNEVFQPSGKGYVFPAIQ